MFYESSLTTCTSMWTLYLGRPLHNYSKAVSIERPISFSTTGTERHWAPYSQATPSAHSSAERISDPQDMVSEHWVRLFEIMSALQDSLYGHRRV